MVKGEEKIVYGVLGYPVKHSLSPAMHNAAFAHLKINAEYRLFEVKPQELDPFLSSLVQGEKDIRGLNVTVPYKEKVLEFVKLKPDSLYLKKLGAVNTIVSEEGTYCGYNTDIFGFLQHLKEHIEPKEKRVAILGAGGACRAVSFALALAKAKEIAIFDIDAGKAAKVIMMLKGLFPALPVSQASNLEALAIEDKDILINATPVGLKESEPSPVKEEFLHQGLLVYDLIYNPQETKLLALARKKGARTANGLGMLLYQGALSFKLFTGQDAPLEVMRKALKEGVEKL
jgi:shikimate dehydrogenase